MNDQAIVQRLLERDEDAISEAKKQYENYCMYIANNVLHDRQDSEECMNDALLAAWNSIPPQKPENLRTYLGKLIREIAINRWKKNTRQKRIRSEIIQSLDEMAEIVSGGDIETSIEENELSKEISKFLYSIDETKRNVFIRRYWYYDSVREIAADFGVNERSIATVLFRMRAQLKKELLKEGIEL